MDTFIDLLKTSVIVQGVITIGLLVVVSILILQGRPVPQLLEALTTLTVGFYFGSKAGLAQGQLYTINTSK